jgi:hypothetical protein
MFETLFQWHHETVDARFRGEPEIRSILSGNAARLMGLG